MQGAKASRTPHCSPGLRWDVSAWLWASEAVRKLCPGGMGCMCPRELESCSSSEDGGPESALSRHLLAGFDSPFPLPWESVAAVPEHKAEWFLLGPRPVPQDC